MEDRLEQFKERKEEEVASQLERQLDKREEIMRNKALIEIRKREALIRAEIEAQLGIKRAEIRDRLSNLTQQMDNFKETAEIKMREAVEKQIQGEIDVEESEFKARQEEFRELQNLDSKAEKRQMWMQSISGQDRKPAITLPDPSTLGARTGTLGATGGRPLRGIVGQTDAEPKPRIGLAGMRAPTSSAKPLIPSSPLVRPVKAPIASAVKPPVVELPKPIKKIGITKLQPITDSVSEVMNEESTPSEVEETTEQLDAEPQPTATLTPITTTLTPQQQSTNDYARLTPIKHMLMPEKKTRGAPPSKNIGKKKQDSDE